jgi:glucose-1-phosphate thymidylyltransferase
VFDFDITPLLERARHEPVIGLYDLGALEPASRYGVVELDAAGYITSFVEKPPQPASTLIALALYGFPSACLKEIDVYLDGGGTSDAMGSFIEWLHKRRPVVGWVFSGRWIDIGSPAEYARVQEEFGA